MKVAVFLSFILISANAEEFVAKIGNGQPAPDEYIFWLNPEVPMSQLKGSEQYQDLVTNYKMSMLQEYQTGRLSGALIRAEAGIMDALRTNSLVLNVAPNFRLYGAGSLVGREKRQAQCIEEEDALGNRKWDLTRISARERPNYNGGTYHYTDHEQGEGVDVYVMDSGINTAHVSFTGGRASHGFTAAGLAADEGDDDLHGHGSHVAGLVAGDIYGTAKQANVIAVKVLNSENWGYYSWWTEGLQWIIQDFRAKKAQNPCAKCVVNMSLGGTYSGDTFEPSIREAIQEGCVFVVAAMNEGSDACPYTPAFMPEVITVGATTNADMMASWSNYGTCVDMLAPGNSIVSAYRGSPTATATFSGTSMATPLTAGVIARNIGNLAEMPSTDDIRDNLLETATFGLIGNADPTNTPNYLLFAECEMVAPGQCSA